MFPRRIASHVSAHLGDEGARVFRKRTPKRGALGPSPLALVIWLLRPQRSAARRAHPAQPGAVREVPVCVIFHAWRPSDSSGCHNHEDAFCKHTLRRPRVRILAEACWGAAPREAEPPRSRKPCRGTMLGAKPPGSGQWYQYVTRHCARICASQKSDFT